jgi:uncharacterized protein YoxC
MELNELHKALAELETSLKNLDSARKQVEQITLNSDQLNNSTKILLDKVDDFIQTVKDNNDGFSESLLNFKTELDDFFDKNRKKTVEENKRILELISTFIDTINSSFDDFNNKSTQAFNTYNNELKKISTSFQNTTQEQLTSFNETIKLISLLIDKQKNEFNHLKDEFINELKKQNKLNLYLLAGILTLSIINIIALFIK